MQFKSGMLAAVAATTLVACGDTDLERGVSGAAIGALAAEATGNDAVVGAAIGGTAGVLCDNANVRGCN